MFITKLVFMIEELASYDDIRTIAALDFSKLTTFKLFIILIMDSGLDTGQAAPALLSTHSLSPSR